MMKKILAVFVCAVLLTGCANNAPSEENTSSKAPKSTRESSSADAPSTPDSKADDTSSAADSSTSVKTESSMPQPAANEKDYEWTVRIDDLGNKTLSNISYKGTDENVVIPETLGGLPVETTPGFYNNIDIKSVTIPASVKSINGQSFAECLNLTEVIFLGETPHFTLKTFENTPWLEAEIAKNADTGLIIIGSALVSADKEKLAGEVVIPDGVTRICYEAFRDCQKITSVSIPDSVVHIAADTFFNCSKLESVTLPKGITEISDGMFAWCGSLKSVDVPDGVHTIGNGAFSACNAVVSLPDSITNVQLGHISTAIFKGKRYEYSEYSREFWEDVRQNAIFLEFGDNDFIITDNILMKINPNVTKIVLPDTVKGIDDHAADDCDRSVIITFKGKNYNLTNLDKLKAAVSAD